MSDERDLKDSAPWLVLLATLAVAIVTMFITIRARDRGEPQVEGELFAKPAAQAPAPPPAAPEEASAAPEEEPPEPLASDAPPSPAGTVYGAAPSAQPATAPPPAQPSAKPPAAGPSGFREMVEEERLKMRKVWFKHVAKSPTLQAYQKAWRSTPELQALTERWHKDHDPIAFLKGVAGQPKFFELLGKYGRSQELLAVLKEDMKHASPKALAAASDTLNKESVIKDLLNKASAATGVPLGAWFGRRPTQEEILKQVLSNPNLKNMPGNDPSRR